MEMQQIRYFLALSETLSFTKAAQRCNVSQPSLTRAIHFLEAELGGELLRRERGLSRLTELGERLLPMIRQCYESALAAKTLALSIRRGETALLSVAVSHSVAVGLLTPALLELSRLFPCLQIDLRRGSGPEVAEWLKSGETELAIAGPLGEAWPRLDAFPVFDEPLDLFVSRKHRLSGRTLVEFKDLASETFLIDTQCELATQISDHLKAKGVANTRVHRVATQNDLLTLLEANLGIAVIPVGAALSDGLSRVPLMEFDLVHTVSAYCVAGRRRGTACACLFKMLRASDWGVETVPERKLEVHQ